MSVLDEESHLGMITFDPVVTADRDHVIAEGDDEGHAIHVIDLGEPFDVTITQSRIGSKETQILGLRRNSIVEGDQPVGV